MNFRGIKKAEWTKDQDHCASSCMDQGSVHANGPKPSRQDLQLPISIQRSVHRALVVQRMPGPMRHNDKGRWTLLDPSVVVLLPPTQQQSALKNPLSRQTESKLIEYGKDEKR